MRRYYALGLAIYIKFADGEPLSKNGYFHVFHFVKEAEKEFEYAWRYSMR